MNRKKVGILFGGMSCEHEVSLLSATSVLENIDREKYEALKNATKDQLIEVKGITEPIADDILDYFGKEQNENNNGKSERNKTVFS